MGLKEEQRCHVTNKSVMFHGFERKTKVSCYMGLKEEQKYHVTLV